MSPSMPSHPPSSLLRRPSAPTPQDGTVHRLTPADAGWEYISFAVHRLKPGEGFERAPDAQEVGVVIAEGAARVQAGGNAWGSVGSRAAIFDGPTPPVVLASPGLAVEVQAE